jgi:hypothetical protein
MTPHLSEHEMAEWLLTGRTEAEGHLSGCPACYAEAERLRSAIRLGRQWVVNTAARDRQFWTRQRLSIRDRMARRQSAVLWRRALTAAAVLLCAALLLLRSPHSMPPVANDEADNALLQQVENDVAQDYPSALAPVALLTQERSAALTGRVTQDLDQTNRNRELNR